MLVNYLKIAIRNILRHKGYSFINITGLAIAMACCMLLLPLKKIHLYLPGQELAGSFLYIFSALALFVLLIICVNFMNIAMAHFSNRALEVGIRKILGAGRRELFFQFLVEALLYSFIAMIFALLLVECTLPSISSLVG